MTTKKTNFLKSMKLYKSLVIYYEKLEIFNGYIYNIEDHQICSINNNNKKATTQNL